jgi:hypothetical protein
MGGWWHVKTSVLGVCVNDAARAGRGVAERTLHGWQEQAEEWPRGRSMDGKSRQRSGREDAPWMGGRILVPLLFAFMQLVRVTPACMLNVLNAKCARAYCVWVRGQHAA